MDALIIWLGNNTLASGLLSAICAFLMLTGLLFWIAFLYDRVVYDMEFRRIAKGIKKTHKEVK